MGSPKSCFPRASVLANTPCGSPWWKSHLLPCGNASPPIWEPICSHLLSHFFLSLGFARLTSVLANTPYGSPWWESHLIPCGSPSPPILSLTWLCSINFSVGCHLSQRWESARFYVGVPSAPTRAPICSLFLIDWLHLISTLLHPMTALLDVMPILFSALFVSNLRQLVILRSVEQKPFPYSRLRNTLAVDLPHFKSSASV